MVHAQSAVTMDSTVHSVMFPVPAVLIGVTNLECVWKDVKWACLETCVMKVSYAISLLLLGRLVISVVYKSTNE